MSYPLAEISPNIEHGAYRKSVYQRYGKNGFDEKGRILAWVRRKDMNSKNSHLRKMANLAQTYHSVTVGQKRLII